MYCMYRVVLINPFGCFYGIEGHVALDINPGPGYDTLTIDPRRQFHTLPSLLNGRAALSNSSINPYVPSKEAVCTICIMVYVMTRPGRKHTTYRMRGGHASN